jgi:hypothetical protein
MRGFSAGDLSCRGRVDVTQAQRWHIAPARSEAELEQLEAAYRVLDLYIWLSFRLEDAFTGARPPLTTLALGRPGSPPACAPIHCGLFRGAWPADNTCKILK